MLGGYATYFVLRAFTDSTRCWRSGGGIPIALVGLVLRFSFYAMHPGTSSVRRVCHPDHVRMSSSCSTWPWASSTYPHSPPSLSGYSRLDVNVSATG